MDRHDEWFLPDSVEEQIEQHLSVPGQSSANARMLHDLQSLAEDDGRRLARIRDRLLERVAEDVERPPVPLQHYQPTPLHTLVQAKPPHSKKPSRLIVKLISGLVALLVIGSMLGVFTLLKPHAEQEDPNHKTPVSATSATPLIHGVAAYVIDATTGKVLVDVNSHAHLSMASTAKIMTAVVAIENADLNQLVTIEQTVLNEVPQGASRASLLAGDQLPLRALLYGLLLPSGDDAALMIAHAVAGNTQNFVAMMNDEAHQLHLNDTHFSNPFGSFAPDDYSSAADLTRLAQYALQLSDFAQVVAKPEYVLSSTSMHHLYLWHNTDTLLTTYSGMNGIQFGTDERAGACMVFSAQRNSHLLIGAELHVQSTDILTSDVKMLLDRGFASLPPDPTPTPAAPTLGDIAIEIRG